MKVIATLVLSALVLFNVQAQEKPNLVIVFLDNFGYGEPGFN